MRALPENSGAGVDVTGGVVTATDSDSSDTLTYSLTGADAASFEIDSNGQISTKTGSTHDFDFDGPKPSYSVNANVSDGKNAAGDADSTIDATIAVTINLTNVNETPDITTVTTTYTKLNVAENTANAAVIATYEATDVDAETTLTWSLEGTDAGDFTIMKNADGHGELKFANVPNFEMPVDADTMNDYDIRVKLEDNGIPGNRGSSNQLDETVSVVVTVRDVNEAPVVSGASASDFAEIAYDATSPDLTVGTYTYTDEDRNPPDTITWGLSGTDAANFAIDSATGVLSFDVRPDFENPFGTDNVYLVIVEADDGQGGVGTFAVTVTVTNTPTPEPAATPTPQVTAVQSTPAPAPTATVVVMATPAEEGGLPGILWFIPAIVLLGLIFVIFVYFRTRRQPDTLA